MTELKTIVLEHLDNMEQEARQTHLALQNQIKALETHQAELERSLQTLTRLYNALQPLITGLNNIVQSK